MKKILSIILRTGIGVALLVFLFTKIDLKATLKAIAGINLFYLQAAIITCFVVYALALYRWRMLLIAQDVKLPLMRVISSFSGGIFFSLFLPSTIGGDIARSVDLGLHTKRRSVIVATVLLDRLSGFVGLVIVAIISLVIGRRLINDLPVYIVIFILAGLLGGILLLIFNERLYNRINRPVKNEGGFRESLRKLHSEIYFFRSLPSILALNLFYSILIQLGSSLVAYFLLRSLSINIKIIYPLVINPVISTITSLPISIGGMGLREWSSVIFYRKCGVLEEAASAQSLLNFALIVIFGIIGGIIYVSTLHHRRIQPHKTDQSS